MAHAMASMTGLEASLQFTSSNRLTPRASISRNAFTVRVQQGSSDNDVAAPSSRRAVLSLVAAGFATGSFVKTVLAEARSIKVGPPPPPSGGLPGTDNSDEARDFSKPLKERFFIQPLGPAEATARLKDSAKEIVGIKSFIDKKAWPYVQNDLRLKASYLRYDLNTVISAKTKEQKPSLKALTGKLFEAMDNLDYAAKIKSSDKAAKYYAETVSRLNDVLLVLSV